MEPFVKHRGTVVPIDIRDVDTDLIIPAEFLTSTSSGGYGVNVFKRLKANQPDCSLNQKRYHGASVIVTDSNFGCGSSREHAVWALKEAGFKAIIGKSFADIFASNSAKNGLVLVVLPEGVVDELLELATTTQLEVEVDLESQMVCSADGRRHAFSYDSYVRHCLLNGFSDMDYLLSQLPAIDRFKKEWQTRRTYSTLGGNN